MHKQPLFPGDRVSLNDYGLEVIGGLRTRAQIQQAQSMLVTSVENINPPGHPPIWTVEVSAPEINKFLLFDKCFDLIERGSNHPGAEPPVQYETWGTPTGRNGIQRTLRQEDADILSEGFKVVDAYGRARTPTLEELNEMGVRRCVAAMDIRTGEMKVHEPEGGTAFFVVKAGRR